LRVGRRSCGRKPDQRKREQEPRCASAHFHPFLSLARAGKGWQCSQQ
jgi:hypothetical protein